jgi:hypothetical protein
MLALAAAAVPSTVVRNRPRRVRRAIDFGIGLSGITGE